MRCLLLFGFMLGSTLAFPTMRLQEPKKDQKIMDLTMETGYMETYGNNYTKHSQVKARQEKSQPQREQKVRMDNRRVSPTNDVTDVHAKTNETVLNQTKGTATEMLSSTLKSLKYFHKRSAEFSDDQYLSESHDSYPDSSSEDEVIANPGDTSENDDSDSSNDSNNTGSSEFSNGAGSSESSHPTESTNSDSEEFTSNSDSQETTPAASDELNGSIGITVQSESSESDTQYSILTTPGDTSEDSNEVKDSGVKAEAPLSSESQSASSSSESDDQSDSNKSSSSSESNSSSDSSEPI